MAELFLPFESYIENLSARPNLRHNASQDIREVSHKTEDANAGGDQEGSEPWVVGLELEVWHQGRVRVLPTLLEEVLSKRCLPCRTAEAVLDHARSGAIVIFSESSIYLQDRRQREQ